MFGLLIMYTSSFMFSFIDDEDFLNTLNQLEQLIESQISVIPPYVQSPVCIDDFSSFYEYQNTNALNTDLNFQSVSHNMFPETKDTMTSKKANLTPKDYKYLNKNLSDVSKEFIEDSINQDTQMTTLLSETGKDISTLNNTNSIIASSYQILNFDLTCNENLENYVFKGDGIEGSSTVSANNSNNIYSSPGIDNPICNKDEEIQSIQFPVGTLNFEHDELNSCKAKKGLKRKHQATKSNLCKDTLMIKKQNISSKISLKTKITKKVEKNKITASNKITTNFKNVIQYSILLKYSKFISKIETFFIEFLEKLNLTENYNYMSIYNLNLTILNDFSFDIFGKLNLENIDMLKTVSTTADMLIQFICFCEKDKNSDLINEIKTIIKECNICDSSNEEIYNFLLEDIFNFLRIEESIYVKSICTEFYSYVSIYDKLKIQNNAFVLNAFIAFLLLVKRNSIVINNLKEVLTNSKYNYRKHKIINTEKCYSSAFLFVFINNLDFLDSSKIKSNMCTNIMYNCISDRFNRGFQQTVHMQAIKILKNYFFYLKDCDIFYNRIEIFEYNSLSLKKNKFQGRRSKEMKKIKEVIKNTRDNIILQVKQILNEIYIKETFKTIFIDFLNDKNFKKKNELNICLDLVYTILHFQDCKMSGTISKIACYIYNFKTRQTKKKQKTTIKYNI